jgi:hypothetical protein
MQKISKSIPVDNSFGLWIYNTYHNSFVDRIFLSIFHKILKKENVMKKDVKKLLAGLGIASLIGAGGILPGAHASGSS